MLHQTSTNFLFVVSPLVQNETGEKIMNAAVDNKYEVLEKLLDSHSEYVDYLDTVRYKLTTN